MYVYSRKTHTQTSGWMCNKKLSAQLPHERFSCSSQCVGGTHHWRSFLQTEQGNIWYSRSWFSRLSQCENMVSAAGAQCQPQHEAIVLLASNFEIHVLAFRIKLCNLKPWVLTQTVPSRTNLFHVSMGQKKYSWRTSQTWAECSLLLFVQDLTWVYLFSGQFNNCENSQPNYHGEVLMWKCYPTIFAVGHFKLNIVGRLSTKILGAPTNQIRYDTPSGRPTWPCSVVSKGFPTEFLVIFQVNLPEGRTLTMAMEHNIKQYLLLMRNRTILVDADWQLPDSITYYVKSGLIIPTN